MKRFTLLSVTALAWFLGMNAWAIESNDNGVYEISSPEDLVAFAQLINGGEIDAKAVLTAERRPERHTVDANHRRGQPSHPVPHQQHREEERGRHL